MASYIPLAYAVVLTVGGSAALANVTAVPVPASRPAAIIMPLTARHGLTTFGLPPVATPPGDPALFGLPRNAPYIPPGARPLRAAWRGDVALFPSPPPPPLPRRPRARIDAAPLVVTL